MTSKTSTRINPQWRKERGFLERYLFGHRVPVLVFFLVVTLVLGYQMVQLRTEASFLRMIPIYHPFIRNYLDHQDDLKGLGNVVRIAVETTRGDIFSAAYLQTLQEMNDEVFFIPGVDRAGLKSLWTPQTRWTEVTAEGFEGGPVIPDTYDGSPESLEQVRRNVMRSGEIGSLVANNFKSSIIRAPLMEIDPETGEPLDYRKFSAHLERVRDKFQSDSIKIHITGFAKIVGDLIDGATRVLLFFAIAFIILLLLLLYNSRCWRSTIVRALSSLVAVIWQMGLLRALGYGLNPYSMLVPFLMFALGVSHGIQMFNAMAQEMTSGADKFTAARRGFRMIYRPGLAALVTDAIGFALLFVIRIGVIQDIAIGATIGVVVVAFTDLMLLPVFMSYSGISPNAVRRLAAREKGASHPVWARLANLTRTRWAGAALVLAALALGWGIHMRVGLQIGDLDPGAPELRRDSRYNRDNAYMNRHYATSSDIFVVMLKTPKAGNSRYQTVVAAERFKWALSQLKGVQGVMTYVDQLKLLNAAFNEGNLKWMAIPRSKTALDNMVIKISTDLASHTGQMSPLLVYLTDHKAETLRRIVDASKTFAAENNTESFQFLLAAGNAGIEAATNIEVEKAQSLMIALVYTVIFLVCLFTYRSVRGALCVVIPLFLTSILCEALMAEYGIGVKVATLPVIAVGVGIGVDYGIYIFNKLRYYLEQGYPLRDAYCHTLNTTGRAVSFTGITLSIGVGSWLFSPIKFQADMGILLAFMFLWNMVGAMVILPALARFLLRSAAGGEVQRRPDCLETESGTDEERNMRKMAAAG